jgi:uncharacterized protein YbgA (DUF1722 family)/uncharacterized protein YbbK (DUF523 family)
LLVKTFMQKGVLIDYPIKPIVLFSKCLGFEHCRYNGEIINDDFVQMLVPLVEPKTVCAEVEIGLGIPRDPIRIVADGDELKLLQPATGDDVTRKMLDFCDSFLSSIDDVDGFILKFRSPSCGIKDVRRFPPGEKKASLGKGAGFFGGAVLERFPHLGVETEGRLKNFRIREQFLIRLYTMARFREMKKGGSMKDLVAFHTQNKFLLMAYNQKELKEMGRIVANPEKRPVAEVISDYGEHLSKAMAKSPRYTSNINVLMHAMGYFSEKISSEEKSYFLDSLQRYRQGQIPLSVCIHIIKSWVIRFDEPYLSQQDFFDPYPEELMFISDSGKGRNL